MGGKIGNREERDKTSLGEAEGQVGLTDEDEST